MTAHAGATATALAALAMLLAACGGEGTAETSAVPEPPTAGADAGEATDGDVVIELVAERIQWDQDTLTAPVGTVTFLIDNQDSGIPHNLRVTGHGIDEATELESGEVVQELEVTFPEAGSYDYICDIHPNMDGTIEIG